ncbi:MAG: leucine-rich repeat protein [Clostridia bacterium]|nr:leucine-rich repeat protein [Clostridia bacterium]
MKKNTEELINAIGQVDDRQFDYLKDNRAVVLRRRRTILLVAALIALLIGAVSLTVFSLRTGDLPPVSGESKTPTTDRNTAGTETGITETGVTTNTETSDPTVPPTSVTEPSTAPTTVTEPPTDPTTVTETPTDPTTVTEPPTDPPTIDPPLRARPPVHAISHKHEWVTERAIAPTCTFPGRTEGQYCAICSDVRRFSDEIPALGGAHDYKDGVCSVCGALQPNDGYVFALAEDGASYEIVSAANVKGNIFVIPENYNGLPVTAIRATDFCPDHNAGDADITVSFYIPDSIKQIVARSLTIRDTVKPDIHIHDLIAWCAINEDDNTFMTEYDGMSWNYSFLSDKGCTLYLEEEKLEDVVLPLDTKIIGKHSFCFNTAIKSVAMAAYITKVYDGAFMGCTSLSSYRFSWQVNEIGYRAFEESGLQSIDIPEGVTEIKAYTFYDTQVKDIYLPTTLESVDDHAFTCSDSVLHITDLAAFLSCSFGGSESNPARGAKEIYIGDVLFEGELRIPSSVTSLGNMALDFGRPFTKIFFPASVQTVGAALTDQLIDELYIDDLTAYLSIDFGYTSTPGTLLANAKKIYASGENVTTRLVVPAQLERIGDHALAGGPFEEIVLPGSLKELGDRALARCTALQEIVVPESVTRIGDAAFAYCNSLKKATLPNCAFGKELFIYCIALESIENVSIYDRISEGMFTACMGLTKIAIPARVTSIGKNAFTNCYNVTELSFAERSSELVIEDLAFSYLKFKTLDLVSGLNVGDRCFYASSNVEVWIFDGVTLSENWAEGINGVIHYAGQWTVIDGERVNLHTLEPDEIFTFEKNETGYTAVVRDDYTGEDIIMPDTYNGEPVTALTFPRYALNSRSYRHLRLSANFKTFVRPDHETLLFYPYSFDTIEVPEENPNVISKGNCLISRNRILLIAGSKAVIPLDGSVQVIADHAFRQKKPSVIYLNDSISAHYSGCFDGIETICFTTSAVPASLSQARLDLFKGELRFNVAIHTEYGLPVEGDGEEFIFALSEDGKGYTLIGSGEISGSDLVIPSSYKGLPVTGIARGAVTAQTFGRLYIPESVVSIARDAFPYCSFETIEVEAGNSVYGVIGGALVKKDEKLLLIASPSLVIPDDGSVNALARGAFTRGRCPGDLFLPATVTAIEPFAFVTAPGGLIYAAFEENGSPAELRMVKNLYTTITKVIYGAQFHYENGKPVFDQTEIVYTVEEIDGEVVLTHVEGAVEEIVLPGFIDGKKITAIGERAFMNVTGLKRVVLPEGIRVINAYGFADAADLSEIILSSTLERIGDHAFTGTAIRRIDLPQALRTIGASAFAWSLLEEIVLPDGVAELGAEAFAYCPNLTSVTLSGNIKTLADKTFTNCTALTTVAGTAGVAEIGEECFRECRALTTFDFGRDLQSIGKGAFSYCSALEKADLSKASVTVILEQTFMASGIKEILLPGTLKTIAARAFNTSRLESFTANDELESIGDRAFSGCAKLKTVVLNDGIRYVAANAFVGCNELNFTVYEGGEYIGTVSDPYFYLRHCYGTSGKLHDGVVIIADGVFSGNEEVVSVTFPEGVRIIGNKAFSGAKALKSVSFPSTLESLGSAPFTDLKKLKEVYFAPCSLASLPDEAFSGCISLSKVTLPEGLQTIGASAFANCKSLTSVTIPVTVTATGKQVFNGCTSLQKIYVHAGQTFYNSKTNRGSTGAVVEIID